MRPVTDPAGSGRGPVADAVAAGRRTLSFEFFPPKTDDGERTLWRALRELEPLHPTFVSVTYGAGGSTRDRTARVTARIAAETTLTPMAHLTCVGATREELRHVVGVHAAAGVRLVLALRGDPPGGPGSPFMVHPGGLAGAADLVRLVKELGDFSVGVAAYTAAHPDSRDRAADVAHLATKLRAGADFAVTQFFFDADDYFRLVEDLAREGVDAPVIPGVMPVTQLSQVERMPQMSGQPFPPDLARRLRAVADSPEAVADVGVAEATRLCSELLAGGAPGLHFYTLNRSDATRRVSRTLAASAAPA